MRDSHFVSCEFACKIADIVCLCDLKNRKISNSIYEIDADMIENGGMESLAE